MIRKILLAGLMAAVAAAIAAPASASALMLYYEEAPIEGGVEMELAGAINWTTSLGSGVDCPATTTITAETLDAHVTGVHIETSECFGTGPYQFCSVTGDQATNLPWTAVPTLAGFVIADETVDYELECFGTTTTTNISVEEVIAEVDNPEAIHALSISGTGTSGPENATLSGEFEVLGEAAGKLSIAE